MSRYRKIHIRMWGDEKFRRLSAPKPNAQTLWVYLLTGTHTGQMPGLSHVGEAALIEALDWPAAAFRKHFKEITDAGMAKADWSARVLWLPNAMRCNPPENTKVLRGWVATLSDIPECDLRRAALAAVKALAVEMGEPFHKAYREAYAKAFDKGYAIGQPNTLSIKDKEQEQEPDPDKESHSPPPAKFDPFTDACAAAGIDYGDAQRLRNKHPNLTPEIVNREAGKLGDEIRAGLSVNAPGKWLVKRMERLAPILGGKTMKAAPPSRSSASPDADETAALVARIARGEA